MNICAIDFPPGVNELKMAGLSTEASALVSVPRIKEAHGALECREFIIVEIGRSRIILGEVLAVYVEDPRLHRSARARRCGSASCHREDERSRQLRADRGRLYDHSPHPL